jgi:lipopolysaccharide export system permease protein
VPLALPLTVLLASLMTFGNFGEHYELVAAKSSGISLGRMFAPLFLVVGLLCGIAFVFSNNVYTYAFQKYRVYLHDVQAKKPALNISKGVYYDKIDGYIIRIGNKGKDGKTIYDVQLYDHTEKLGNTRVTMAKSGLMQTTADHKTLVFTLYDGYSYSEDIKEFNKRRNRPFTKVKFEEQKLCIDISDFAYEESGDIGIGNHHRAMTLSRLSGKIDTMENEYSDKVVEAANSFVSKNYYYKTFFNDSIAQVAAVSIPEPDTMGDFKNRITNKCYEIKSEIDYQCANLQARRTGIDYFDIEAHRKFSLAYACILLFLIGAPLGAIIRKGGLGMPIVVSVFLFLAYYLVSIFGEKYVISSSFPAWAGMWMSAIIFTPLGIFIMIKAISDAKLLDAVVWKERILKLFGRKAKP